ncbi:hypothetical protein LEP1GSC050_2839 [Leptospira broomii serovar Hurstbridge str. 5399]|uniref:SH3b domain-containing protein n=1 Tax=Leptospira broomii serovar Hurstbridge str. 5399 TaxID=1049789 RepID=T0GH48_9LEPT|nr:hypothetical protein LEP1GSC050_2839 [Leptospira broomii serovar Hurstbridge str. 5399]
MLLRIIFLFFIFIIITCRAKNNSVKNLYVMPESGVKLRKEPSLSGKVIEVIAKDTMIIVFSESQDEVIVDGIKGKWLNF